jgi:hypothetical protein
MSETQENKFPWAGQPDEIGCNFAFGHLMRNLPGRLATDGRLHAESLMAASGAIAGLTAQVALLADPPKLEKAKGAGQLLDATMKDGRTFLYGDAINEMLYTNDIALARSRVWNCLVAGALSTGMSDHAIPDINEMFRHVTASLGTDREGFPSTPANHQPLMPVRDLLKLVAPVSFACLTGEIDPITDKNNFRAHEPSWVAITAQLAGNQLVAATQVLKPELCITIAMESAIYASKLRGDDALTPKPQVQA